MMREYEVDVTEMLCSCVTVMASNEKEAYLKAMELLDQDFSAPYHYSCDVEDYTVTATGYESEEDDDE